MVNYEYGKIYKIYSKQQNITYIGSTAQYYLSSRLGKHRGDYKLYLNNKGRYTYSFKVLECEDYKIELLEYYPCANKNQLETRERYYIENNECVNKVIPTRTKKQYKQDNKDKIKDYNTKNKDNIKEYHKKYYKNNEEYFKKYRSQKITCECGCEVTKNHLLRHKTTPKHIKLVQNKL